MSKLSSWLKKRGGKVGELANKVGSVLPSAGQIIGGAIIPGVGQVIGGRLDPHTSDLQQHIGDTVAVAAGTLGAGKLVAGAIPNAPAPKDGDVPGDGAPGEPRKEGGGQTWEQTLLSVGGDIARATLKFAQEHGATALEIANIINASHRQEQADKYAQTAIDTTTAAYKDKAGLRSSGIAGMQNPGANAPDLSKLRSIAGAQSGNPFAGAVPPRLPIPNASAPAPRAPQVTLPNPMAGAALPIAAPPTLAPGMNPATGQRPQPPYDPRKLPLPIATRLNG